MLIGRMHAACKHQKPRLPSLRKFRVKICSLARTRVLRVRDGVFSSLVSRLAVTGVPSDGLGELIVPKKSRLQFWVVSLRTAFGVRHGCQVRIYYPLERLRHGRSETDAQVFDYSVLR
jgi:hypothetical protein